MGEGMYSERERAREKKREKQSAKWMGGGK